MESKRTATTYFIPPGKFLLMENALGNPDLIQSSVSSDCRVTIVDLENFPLDDLEQWPTFRLISSDIKLKLGEGKYHIYIVVPTADNTESTSAFVSYNTRLVDRKGYAQDGTFLGKAGFRYYPCGTVSERGGNPSAATTPSGQGRVVEMDLGVTPTVTNLPGNLSDLEEVFHIEKTDPSNPSSWLMTIVGTVKSMTARIIRVTSSLIFGSGGNERPLVGVAVRKDATTPGMVSDTIIATTAWVDAQFEHMDDRYLSKQKDDKTPFSLGVGKNLSVGEDLEVKGSASIGGEIKSDDFVAGDLMGSGWSIYRDSNGNTVVETDRIVVRQSLEATELVVNQETFEKGSNIFVKGGCTITKVEIVSGKYRCYYDNEEGRRFSGFKVGDQARCQRYSESYGGVIKYYWRLVTSVEEDYIELSMTDCDGTGIPEEGDDIAQLGSRYDKTRQSAIVISPDNGGSVIVWAGIDSFSLTEKNMVGMGVNPNTGRAYLYGYGDMFFGDRSLEKNYITYQTRDGETEPTLNISADIHFGKGSDGLSNLSEFKDIQGDVDNLFNQIEREFTIWYYDYVPTLDNEPAVNWVSDSDKALHDQDIFFSDKLARAWRFVNGAWVEITDERTLSALKLAEDAQVAAEEAKKNAREAKEYIDNVLPYKLEDLQNQIDGAIESFFYKYNPTTSNEPASFWITEEQKAMHLNDTFTNLESGYSWRWTKNGSVYGWTEISDTATVKALVAAGQAQDTADQKRRVFVKTPYTPYDEGDLWVQGETGDIMRCSKSRASGNFVSSDWGKASKYTDDTALTTFINGDYKTQLESVKSQVDQKAETWYQSSDPSSNWTTTTIKNQHIGDLWYNTNKGQSFVWNGNGWSVQDAPDSVYDKIDGKASIYTSQPSSYKKNDLWVLTSDTTLDKSYKSGTIVVAKQDSNTFVASNWTKLDRYTDDTKAEESIKKISDIEYIKGAFGKDDRVMDGGVLVSKLVSVQNSSGNIEAFINGSDYAKDSVHGKLIIAGGIPEEGSSLEERSRNALTRIYENGTLISDNVKVKGEINATSGTFDNVHINGTIRTKWDVLKYKVLYYSSNSVEQWGFDGSAIYSDKIILNGGIGSPELLMAWGDDADGREIVICNKCIRTTNQVELGLAVKVEVPTGKYIVDLDGTKTSGGNSFNIEGKKIYYMIGFNEGWYVTNILNL